MQGTGGKVEDRRDQQIKNLMIGWDQAKQRIKKENKVNCALCGKGYSRRGKRKTTARHGSCCSLKCSHLNLKNKTPKRIKPVKGKMVSCSICNKEWYSFPSQAKKYCSIACRDLDVDNTSKRSGVNHYKWKGGIKAHRGSDRNLRAWKRRIIKRDGRNCASCGETKGIMCIDHVLPWSAFVDLRYVDANGQTLCAKCHRVKTRIENKNRDKKGNLKNGYKRKVWGKYNESKN